MGTDTRDGRPLIFLTVLVLHAAIVSLFMRAARQVSPLKPMTDSLILLLLPPTIREIPDAVQQALARALQHAPSSMARIASAPAVEGTPIVPTAPGDANARGDANALGYNNAPPIDWEQEAQLAALSAQARWERQSGFRDLAALSPEQLRWVRQNHMEPAPPGIPWKYRRVEMAEGGMPIIHINDHCIAVPFLMMMVFCKIGHIEPKGDLFEHLHDPRTP